MQISLIKIFYNFEVLRCICSDIYRHSVYRVFRHETDKRCQFIGMIILGKKVYVHREMFRLRF